MAKLTHRDMHMYFFSHTNLIGLTRALVGIEDGVGPSPLLGQMYRI